MFWCNIPTSFFFALGSEMSNGTLKNSFYISVELTKSAILSAVNPKEKSFYHIFLYTSLKCAPTEILAQDFVVILGSDHVKQTLINFIKTQEYKFLGTSSFAHLERIAEFHRWGGKKCRM